MLSYKKLESLNDRRAEIKDINKEVWEIILANKSSKNKYTIVGFSKVGTDMYVRNEEGNIEIKWRDSSHLFWDKAVIISEDEYNYLKNK